MSPESVMKFVIFACVALLILAIRWWAKKYPNRSKEHPDRRRMVRFIPVVGWVFAIGGAFFLLVTLFTDQKDPLGPYITCMAMLLAGTGFLLMYRNFYVAPRDYEVAFRTVLGKERVIVYTDIARYSVMPPSLSIKSVQGVKLDLNINIYDMTPLLRAIESREATGHWPVRPATALKDIAG